MSLGVKPTVDIQAPDEIRVLGESGNAVILAGGGHQSHFDPSNLAVALYSRPEFRFLQEPEPHTRQVSNSELFTMFGGLLRRRVEDLGTVPMPRSKDTKDNPELGKHARDEIVNRIIIPGLVAGDNYILFIEGGIRKEYVPEKTKDGIGRISVAAAAEIERATDAKAKGLVIVPFYIQSYKKVRQMLFRPHITFGAPIEVTGDEDPGEVHMRTAYEIDKLKEKA